MNPGNPGNPRNPRIRWMSSRIADLRVNNDDDDDDDYYDDDDDIYICIYIYIYMSE